VISKKKLTKYGDDSHCYNVQQQMYELTTDLIKVVCNVHHKTATVSTALAHTTAGLCNVYTES